jgi:hypothetical protein
MDDGKRNVRREDNRTRHKRQDTCTCAYLTNNKYHSAHAIQNEDSNNMYLTYMLCAMHLILVILNCTRLMLDGCGGNGAPCFL